MQCELVDGWTAYLDTMPGKPHVLRVDGTIQFSEGGWSAELRRKVPQGINPQNLLLELVVTEDGPGHTEALTQRPVRYEQTAEPEDITSVTVLPANCGDSGGTVEVQIVT